MRKGIVTHIDLALKQGHIEDENGQDILFDLDHVQGNINTGDDVEFQIILGPKGLVANEVEAVTETSRLNLNGDNTANCNSSFECQH